MQAQRRYAAPVGAAMPGLDVPARRGIAGALPLSPAAAASLAASAGGAGRAASASVTARDGRAPTSPAPAAAAAGWVPARSIAGGHGALDTPHPHPAAQGTPAAPARGMPLASAPISAPMRVCSEAPSPAGVAPSGWVPPASVYASAPPRAPVQRSLDAGSCSPVRLRGSDSDDSDAAAASAGPRGAAAPQRDWASAAASSAAAVGTPPAGRAPVARLRRVSAPAHDALVWRAAEESDDDDEDGTFGGAGDVDQAAEAARRAETLRALRAAAITRRVSRMSEHRPASAGGGAFADAQAGLPALVPPAELAARIARLDVHLQRYLAGVLCGLEGASAPPPMSPPPPPAFAAPPPLAPAARRGSPAPDLFSDEGGPCGGGVDADVAAAGGYASPGGRDTSASDDDPTVMMSPPRQPRRSVTRSPRRAPRFSAAGVAGEARLPRRAPLVLLPPPLLGSPSDDAAEAEEQAALQESPRPMGASAPRLAARRVSHGHPGGVLPSDLAAAALRSR